MKTLLALLGVAGAAYLAWHPPGLESEAWGLVALLNLMDLAWGRQ